MCLWIILEKQCIGDQKITVHRAHVKILYMDIKVQYEVIAQ